MSASVSDATVTIRDLQRHAAAVLERIEHGETVTVTRHGRAVARIIPPDPADEAVAHAVQAGVLDPVGLANARTAAQTARIRPEPADPAGDALSDALTQLREADGER